MSRSLANPITSRPAERKNATTAIASPVRIAYCRAAARIIFRCNGVHEALRVSRLIRAHSTSEGNCRRSGRAFHIADRSARRSSARPLRVNSCFFTSHWRRAGTR